MVTHCLRITPLDALFAYNASAKYLALGAMSTPEPTFEYPSTLEGYTISEEEFYVRNPSYNQVCTGAVIFNNDGKVLLVQRAKDEHAFPNAWEIPGGKVEGTDKTILHAVAREVKEETGLDVTKFVRKVAEFGWNEYSERRKKNDVWRKLIFEVEVEGQIMDVVLDPVEHQAHVFATEEDVARELVGDVTLAFISPVNKTVTLDAFRLKKETLAALSGAEKIET